MAANKTKRSTRRNKLNDKRVDEDRDTRGRTKENLNIRRGNGQQDVRRLDREDR